MNIAFSHFGVFSYWFIWLVTNCLGLAAIADPKHFPYTLFIKWNNIAVREGGEGDQNDE